MEKKRHSNTITNYFVKKSKPSTSEQGEEDKVALISVADENVTELSATSSNSSEFKIKTISSENDNGDIIVNKYDIGNFINPIHKLDEQHKIDILKNVWIPDSTFKFPVLKSKLKFQHSWLQKYTWLSYSRLKSGAFCKYCVLFARNVGGVGQQPLGALCSYEFTNWKHAHERFNAHSSKEYHKKSILVSQNLLLVINNKIDSVALQLDKEKKNNISFNRQLLLPVIQTIIVCGQQGLALRGHDDSGPLSLTTPVKNDGNFRSLLRFALSYNDTLADVRKRAAKNAHYISPTTQNQIIEACNEIILKSLVLNINKAEFFSILADETADISGIEQFSLSARYVSNNKIHECFLQFVPVVGTTGKNLADNIIETLNRIGINTQYLIGQGYDGAASMSGKFNGVQSLIKTKFPQALYVHCSAHSLNLAVGKACDIPSIRNTMGVIESTYCYFNTPKRMDTLKNEITNLLPETKRQKLIRLCPTRWVERHDSVIRFLELLPAVLSALEIMCDWDDRDSATKAFSLLSSIKNVEFLVSLLVLDKIFQLSIILCRSLQKEQIDLREAVQYAQETEKELHILRQNSDVEFSLIFNKLTQITDKYNINIAIPRLSKRQTQRCNVTTNSPEVYFKISIFIPFLDTFLQNINSRFLQHNEILKGFQCILPTYKFLSDNKNNRDYLLDEASTENLILFYASYLDSSEIVKAELKMWYRHLIEIKDDNFPKQTVEYLKYCDKTIYPNIYKLITILTTLPVTTCTAERSFSTLRRLKSYLRSTMSENRLNGLALLNIYRNIEISTEEVLQELMKRKRRLNFDL